MTLIQRLVTSMAVAIATLLKHCRAQVSLLVSQSFLTLSRLPGQVLQQVAQITTRPVVRRFLSHLSVGRQPWLSWVLHQWPNNWGLNQYLNGLKGTKPPISPGGLDLSGETGGHLLWETDA